MLLVPVFLPLIAGFVLLFMPNKIRRLSRALTLIISVVAFIWAVRIFIAGQLSYTHAVFQIENVKLDLLLAAKPLGAFILMFATGFGLLITLYSLKSAMQSKRANEFFGAVLLTIGGSAGILLSNHLIFLLIFWEIVTVSLYILITTGGKNSNFRDVCDF